VNLTIGKSTTGQVGTVNLGGAAPMMNNLTLNGANNSITINNGGFLLLGQAITAAGREDVQGGIDFGGNHAAGTVSVSVNTGGTLMRSGAAAGPGIINQVEIDGAVYNYGGLVSIQGTGELLHLWSKDAAGRSYWQQVGGSAQLYVQGGNINAAGTFEIDTGTVQFMAVSGATSDYLDGAGLIFGNANQTALTIVDSTRGTPGTVTIQGPVTLAANTTTTENFAGGGNTADLIDVQNGTLTLNGTLNLISGNGRRPLQALNFLDDQGGVPTIAANFTTIDVLDIPAAVIANAIINNGGVLNYQVTIT
jgi:hypothetical protein